MENMARLALLERNVQDNEKFKLLLQELLQHIGLILENPHDNELRTFNRNLVKTVLQYEAFVDYLKYLGFQLVGNEFNYPKESTLSNLRMAQAAIERKIQFCYGTINKSQHEIKKRRNKGPQIVPHNILTTKNPLLLKLEALFNSMIKYEDEELQDKARDQIPIVTLQLMALERIRDQQKKIKTGEVTTPDLSYDLALLMELLVWFKYKYFTWVDKPTCDKCGGPTTYSHSSEGVVDSEKCLVENYTCKSCADGGSRFPRHNDPAVLLRRRRGRCGEWANCFALLCRALGYDTRYVYDITDHVWCEVFDFDSKSWLHVDPCESKLDAPLMYSVGWGKKLSYVFAVSKDDLQDVTWRYTTDHKEVLKRRNMCKEDELVSTIMDLRTHRQTQVTEARRKYLALRTLKELVELMKERKASSSEFEGRISGARAWREGRGEVGKGTGGEFLVTAPGTWRIEYSSPMDHYVLFCDDKEESKIATWNAGASSVKNVFRKEEHDWNMVYLAREEGEPSGEISWQLNTQDDIWFDSLSVKITTALYEDGKVTWTVKFDDGLQETVNIKESGTRFVRMFKKALLTARLEGGKGNSAWQHSQLCRQQKNDKSPTFQIYAHAKKQ